MIKPGPQKFQLKASSNHHVVSYINVWACNINSSTEASAYEEIRRVFSFFIFIEKRISCISVQWNEQLHGYSCVSINLLTLLHFSAVFFNNEITFNHTWSRHLLKLITQGKADLWYLLCSCTVRHKLYSEIFRPTFNPTNRSFPCACIPKNMYVCLSVENLLFTVTYSMIYVHVP